MKRKQRFLWVKHHYNISFISNKFKLVKKLFKMQWKLLWKCYLLLITKIAFAACQCYVYNLGWGIWKTEALDFFAASWTPTQTRDSLQSCVQWVLNVWVEANIAICVTVTMQHRTAQGAKAGEPKPPEQAEVWVLPLRRVWSSVSWVWGFVRHTDLCELGLGLCQAHSSCPGMPGAGLAALSTEMSLTLTVEQKFPCKDWPSCCCQGFRWGQELRMLRWGQELRWEQELWWGQEFRTGSCAHPQLLQPAEVGAQLTCSAIKPWHSSWLPWLLQGWRTSFSFHQERASSASQMQVEICCWLHKVWVYPGLSSN